MIIALFFGGCFPSTSLEETGDDFPSVALTEPLAQDEVRLGMIENASALFGGISLFDAFVVLVPRSCLW